MQAEPYTRQQLRNDIRADVRKVVRHIYFALVCQTAVLLGIAYFYVTQIANI